MPAASWRRWRSAHRCGDLYNQTGEFGSNVTKPGSIGCQYNYRNLQWMPGSPVFDRARASGLRVANWQDVILVNMLGKRFYDETGGQYIANNYNSVDPYVQGSWRNAKNIKYDPNNFLNAALAGIDDGHNGGGPIWAIFDSDAVEREQWQPTPPNVDIAAGFFFSANRLADLAEKIVMKYQRVPMPPAALEETVARYNAFVDAGIDADFGKPKPHVQDRQAALLCRLGDTGGARHARRPAHQCRMPGDRHERRGHPWALLRRRISRRLQPARPRAGSVPRLHRRQCRCCGTTVLRHSWWQR